jgi:hypothetical protein
MLMMQMENKKIDSWAIRWLWSVFINNGLVLFPSSTLVLNIGYDESATHTTGKPQYVKNVIGEFRISSFPERILCDEKKWNVIKRYLAKNHLQSDNTKTDVEVLTLGQKIARLFKTKH